MLQKISVAPLVGAWIEIERLTERSSKYHVAPLVGAWIEIYGIDLKSTLLSRSSRGSVDWNCAGVVGIAIGVSLLSWERGLKWLVCKSKIGETGRSSRGSVDWNLIKDKDYNAYDVAPLVGAWIEMPMIAVLAAASTVAPLVGAWIEILRYQQPHCDSYRRSSRGSVDWNDFAGALPSCRVVSLLSWERGLKFSRYIPCRSVVASLLSWERGLKYRISLFEVKTKKSLLSRERGLKYWKDRKA